MRKILLAATAAASAFAMAPAAQAAVTIVSFSTTAASTNPSRTSIGFEDSMLAVGDFSETITFTSDVASDFVLSLTTSVQAVDFGRVFLTASGSTTPIFTFGPSTGGNPEFLGGSTFLPVGTFTLNITGTNRGPQLGALGGTVSMTAAPMAAVPEPATWAMMLFGFGAVGYSMRGRRRVGYKSLQAV